MDKPVAIRTKPMEWVQFLLMNVLGMFIYAVGVICFTSPNNVAPGGFTAIGTMLQSLFGFPVGVVTFLLNLPLLIWAWFDLSRAFTLKTAFCTFLCSVILDATDWFAGRFGLLYVGDPVLAAIFGGVIMGLGLSIVVYTGATSGGTTALGVLLKKRNPQFQIGKLGTIINFFIVLLSMAVYRDLNAAMYALICIFTYGKTMDAISYGLNSHLMILIISQRSGEIKEAILSEMGRGATVLNGEGAYQHREMDVLMTVIRKDEYYDLRRILQRVDNRVFFIATEASEVQGRGFRQKGL